MLIEYICLNNFRNISHLQLIPSNKFNFIFGKNAQGKTSILESIYVAAFLKSFRSSKNEDIITFQKKFSSINIIVDNYKVKNEIDFLLTKESKKIKIDGKKPVSYKDFFNYLRPLLFSPEEIILIKGSPAGRRAFLDRAVFQTSSGFIESTIQYNKYLRNRNLLLKEKKHFSEIEPWTEGLIKYGSIVRLLRNNFLKRITPIFKSAFEKITSGCECADLSSPFIDYSEFDIEEAFRQDLIKYSDREIIFGQTITGPHRDDPVFLINGRPLRQFASQGQQRSFVMAFKTAQIIDMENIFGATPILLLDDITSELDRDRQQYFFKFLRERSGQVFITSTEVDPLLKNGSITGKFFEVDKGQIQEMF